MRLNRPARRGAMIGLTPLIDVVFLLLIFFMLASTFLKFSSTPVAGGAGSGPALDLKEIAMIQLLADRQVSVNGRMVAFDGLSDLLDELADKAVRRGVIRPTPEASVQDLADVLAVVRTSRLSSVVIVR